MSRLFPSGNPFTGLSRTATGFLAVFALTVAAGPASGQQGSVLEEIVITAQKREQVLLEVPLSVQAFTGDELQDFGVRDIQEVINFIPGASEGRSTSAATRTYQIRGVSSFYGDTTVGYYLDDAAFTLLNRNYAPVARTFDIERVEVLRGPQGTLWGQGAMGGTMRFISADPDLQQVRVRGGAGVSDTKDGDSNYFVDGALSVPVIEDQLGFRVSGSYETLGGYAESPSEPGQKDEDTIESYRVKGLWTPNDMFTVKALYQHNEIEDQLGKQLATAEPPTHSPNGPLGRGGTDSEYDLFSAYIGIDTGAILIESTTGYIEDEATAIASVPFGPAAGSLDTTGDSEIFSQEIRLVSQYDNNWEWVVGGYYQDAKRTEGILAVVPGGPPFLNFTESSTFDSSSYALFGEISYQIGRLKPLIGLRYFEDDREFDSINQSTILPLPPTVTNAEETFDSTSPRFNLSYEANDSMLFYGNIAKGYRSGTFNTTAAINSAPPGLNVPSALDPDELWSYELGTKLEMFDNSLILEAAAYYLDWDDYLLQINPNFVSILLNAGTVEGMGIDYSLNWRTPLDGLSVQLTGNFNETEFDQIDPGAAAFLGNTRIQEGEQVPTVPDTNVTLALDYVRPIGRGGWDFALFTAYTYTSEIADPTFLPESGEDQDLLRLRTGFTNGNWGVFLYGNNLLDHDDPTYVSGSGVQRLYPRVIGVELTVDY